MATYKIGNYNQYIKDHPEFTITDGDILDGIYAPQEEPNTEIFPINVEFAIIGSGNLARVHIPANCNVMNFTGNLNQHPKPPGPTDEEIAESNAEYLVDELSKLYEKGHGPAVDKALKKRPKIVIETITDTTIIPHKDDWA